MKKINRYPCNFYIFDYLYKNRYGNIKSISKSINYHYNHVYKILYDMQEKDYINIQLGGGYPTFITLTKKGLNKAKLINEVIKND